MLPRKCPALAIAMGAAVIATNAGAQRKPAPRLLNDSEARTLLAASALTLPTTEAKYLHRITEMTMGDGVKGRAETFAMAPDKILNIVWFPGLGTSQTGFDGTTGWSISPLTGAVILDGPHLQRLKGGLRPRGVITRIISQPSARGGSLYATGTTKIDRRVLNAYLLVDNGDSSRIWLDLQTGLLAAFRPLHVGQDPVDTTSLTLFSDYKTVDGTLQPTTTIVRGKGSDFVSRIVAIDHEPIDSARFAPPAAVISLISHKP